MCEPRCIAGTEQADWFPLASLQVLLQPYSPGFTHLACHVWSVPFQAVDQPGLPFLVHIEAAVQTLLANGSQTDVFLFLEDILVRSHWSFPAIEQCAASQQSLALAGHRRDGVVMSPVEVCVRCPPAVLLSVCLGDEVLVALEDDSIVLPHLQVLALVGFQREFPVAACSRHDIVSRGLAVHRHKRIPDADALSWDGVLREERRCDTKKADSQDNFGPAAPLDREGKVSFGMQVQHNASVVF